MSEHETCPDCELETLGPDDHKCPNPECPSHDAYLAEREARPAFTLPRPGPVPYDVEEMGRRVSWHGRPVPQSRAEWQYCVDLAQLCLSIESARLYGLVTGGPEVNVGKCEWMIDAAARQGIHPDPPEGLLAGLLDALMAPA